MVIDVALGNEPKLERVTIPKIAKIKFIFSQNELDELNRIKQTHPEQIYFVSEIDEVGTHKVVDSSSRFGYYILAIDK